MNKYTFYEALKEVMENRKEFESGNVKMCRQNDALRFFYIDTSLGCNIQEVTTGDVESMWTEYEPPVDWSKVAVDTKIEVSDNELEWYKKHFSCFDNGMVRTFANGQTSFTSARIGTCWKYARLYKE